jgi:hypothetical protein
MAWFGEMNGFGRDWMLWDTNINQLGQLGFHVEIFDNDSGLYRYLSASEAKTDYLEKMDWLANQNALHGLYFMGHGNEESVGSRGTRAFTYGPKWEVFYTEMDSLIDYKLGALIIHACYGNDSNAQNDLLSNNGIYWGANGVYSPILVDPISYLWGYVKKTIGGKQKTNQF